MKLYEFFGNINHDVNQDKDHDPNSLGKEEEKELGDNLFWYILDHDNFHKKFFMPAAKEIKRKHTKSKTDESHDWQVWMPMVNAGCAEFFKKNHVSGDPRETFNKKFRIDICKKLADHYHKDILKGEYKLGN
jgi:hypothetical protein